MPMLRPRFVSSGPASPCRVRWASLLSVAFLTIARGQAGGFAPPVEDVAFVQEYHVPYPIAAHDAANDVRAVLVDDAHRIWAATREGVFLLQDDRWSRFQGTPVGPAYALAKGPGWEVWVGTWDGLYRIDAAGTQKVAEIGGPVTVLGAGEEGWIALGPEGAWRQEGGLWRRIEADGSRNVRDWAYRAGSGGWLATGVGLFEMGEATSRLYHRVEELISSEVNALAFSPAGQLWIGSLGGLDVYDGRRRIASYTPEQGLPCSDVRSLAFAPDGTLWVGTALGVARFDGSTWSLRHSRRWLLNDEVRDVAFAPDGTAWVATAGGVSAIRRRTMTLAEKADHYLAICRQRHVRPPGLVEKCRFPDPQDLTAWQPVDDDNDGQYTAMYLAMESYRYAVTGDPGAKRHADEAYAALEFLQTVTGTTGFVARTVVPSDWTRMADANEQVTVSEAVERRVRDPRNKIVEERWRPSADGRWLWKGDTSSDEITGHMYGYRVYYDLAADDAHKTRVRHLVRRIMDYIIDGGYTLRDIDGQPTRWGVWSPQQLNHDPDWRVERPINSFEILSYLLTVHHLTGEDRYLRACRALIEQHGYADNASRPKAYGLSERTHIDDELLALAAPGLFRHLSDPTLHARLMLGYAWAYQTVEHEQDPFFNFTYGLLGGGDFHLAESVAFLRDTPLDLRQWTVDSSRREDLKLVRHPMPDSLQTDRLPPPSERGVMRWDKNPWEVTSGDFHDPEGRLESCGVFWLLPYWMGRYYGFIGS